VLRTDWKKAVAVSAVLASRLLVPADLQAGGGGTITGAVTWGPKRLRDAVVYIERADGKFRPSEKAAIMNQQNLTFVPHVLPILAGATVDFLNQDGVLHNLHAFEGQETLFNMAMPKFIKKKTRVFEREGVVLMLCDVHQEMSAYIVALQNPFFAVTNERGEFIIRDIPPGSYTLRTWHEKLKPQSRQVQLKEGEEVKADFRMRN
jgi:plastocyanin